MLTVSIIIPTLGEAQLLGETLEAIACMRQVTSHGQVSLTEDDVEVIVVDGGSCDATEEVVLRHGVRFLRTERGRGPQMHGGACAARGDVLWFLHADTLPPPHGIRCVREALLDEDVVAGNFSVRFDARGRVARFLTWLYPRLRLFGLCYGDSAIFVRRTCYERIQGFRPFPIFEDVDLVRRLRSCGRFVHLSPEVAPSSRRFEGKSPGLLLMRWGILQLLYWAGVSPYLLGHLYPPHVAAHSSRKPP